MKTLRSVAMMVFAVTFVAAVSVQGQDFRSPIGGRSRSFLGLPIPQQWTGAQWTGTRPPNNQNTGYGGYRNYYSTGSNSGTCRNGQCPNASSPDAGGMIGNCASGRCATGSCQNCNCPAGACESGLCASGQCAACENGQCAGCENGQCASGQCVSGNCPNGQCRQNQYQNSRSNYGVNYGVEGNRASRSTRSNVADPYRQADFDNGNDNWTPRAATRKLNNVLSPSRYDRNELELRRQYFNNESGELNDSLSGESTSVSRDIRAPRPTERSMFGAPGDRPAGLAQI